jgi:hypothetical protein
MFNQAMFNANPILGMCTDHRSRRRGQTGWLSIALGPDPTTFRLRDQATKRLHLNGMQSELPKVNPKDDRNHDQSR